MTNDSTLYIIAEVEETEEVLSTEGERNSGVDTGGGWGEKPKQGPMELVTQNLKRKRVPIDAQALKAQMQGMISIVNDLFEQTHTEKDLQLSEVELSVEINAEGQISVVGNGGKLGNTGGITLKFLRPNQHSN